MRVSIIVAVSENGVIGRNGTLPWHLSADLQRFKRLTMGHTIIMGRRTWESIGRALPGRRTIVVTRQPIYRVDVEGVAIAANLADALQIAKATGDAEAFIVGGGELYRDALPIVDRMYLTVVMAEVEGDTYFVPDHHWQTFDWDAWVSLETEIHDADSKNDHPYTFATFQRCEPRPASKS